MKIRKIMISMGMLIASTSLVQADLSPKFPPDLGAIVGVVGNGISKADDLGKLVPELKKFPARVDAITSCMNYKAKSLALWAQGMFTEKEKTTFAARNM